MWLVFGIGSGIFGFMWGVLVWVRMVLGIGFGNNGFGWGVGVGGGLLELCWGWFRLLKLWMNFNIGLAGGGCPSECPISDLCLGCWLSLGLGLWFTSVVLFFLS